MAEIPNQQRCKRSDGKGWQCRLPAKEGNVFCELHYQQSIRRQRRQPIPSQFKLGRSRRSKPEDPVPSFLVVAIGAPSAPATPIGSKSDEPGPDSAAKEPGSYDAEEVASSSDPEKERTVSDHQEKSDFDKGPHLHLIRKLLPVLTKMNEEKFIELAAEAKSKGISDAELLVQVARDPQKKECSFCKACIPDLHRKCGSCSYTLCIGCCQEFRDGNVENLQETKFVRSKMTKNTSWGVSVDGIIRCPPKNLGGCNEGILKLASLYPIHLTKALEESAKKIVCDFNSKKLDLLPDPSPCSLCNENGEVGLYFSTKQKLKDDNLEHFMKHWGKGQPVVVRNIYQSQSDLEWDFGFMLCNYLEKSFESRNNTGFQLGKGSRDWCKIELIRSQIFSRGIAHENVWDEFLKFKLWLSLDFFQDHFPNHYNAVIQSLPIQEYMNPLTGFLNLGAYSPCQKENSNLKSYVSISYGGLDNPMDADLLSNLRYNACDVVNVLVHATGDPISERMLNVAKKLIEKYNSQEHLKSSRKIAKRNQLEQMFAGSTRLGGSSKHEVVVSDESESESDDEDFSQVVNSCGVHWDIFRREDVPMLLEYLRKYSNKLLGSHRFPTKVVHPLFDEVFYLTDDHKTRLKEEFNVDALSFKQNIGEAVIIPAGCPFQMKNIMPCVNVVYKFMSPESALEGIKVSDEIRLLPVNHKAKGNMVQVKKMVLDRMQAAIEEMREVSASQIEWYWPFVISRFAKPLS